MVVPEGGQLPGWIFHCVGGVQKSAGAEDDDNVSLEQFTHIVVRLFEQFFRILDRTEAGYLTQVMLSPH